LVTQYGKSGNIRWLPPTIQEMKVEGGKMILKMARYEVITCNDGIPLDTLRNALKAEDVKRRLHEAETFLKEHPGAATGKAAQD